LKYRADIDVLRAVAVVSVVVYHVGNSVGFNGYLGVDIFFVISGYLIASIILADLRNDRFSFKEFYLRRARRILPALLTVLTVTSIAASVVLLPNEALPFARSVFAAIFFYSNFLFYSESGYFDTSAELKPLLHTWSLSVEEQFYLVFPVLMLIGFRRGTGFLKLLIPSALLLSLIWNLSFPGLFKDENFAFFMFPVRAWELLSGASLAVYASANTTLRRGWADCLSFLGLVLILTGLLITKPEDYSYVLLTLPVVLGTCLIIFAGSGASPPLVNRGLGTKIFLFFGKISYSLYLWHWPLYVLLLYYSFGRLSDVERTLIGLLSVVLSYFTWRFIEQPFRKKALRDLLPGLRVSLVPLALTVAIAGYLVAMQGLLPWTDANFQRFVKVEFGGDFKEIEVEGLTVWMLGLPGDPETGKIALFGDSHAKAIAPAIHDMSEEAGVTTLLFRNQCIAIDEDLLAHKKFKDCVSLAMKQAEFIARSETIGTVIIAGRWFAKTKLWANRTGFDMKKTWALREESLLNLVEKLTGAGKQVVVLAQVPLVETRFKRSLPSVVARMIQQGHPELKDMIPSKEGYLAKNRKVLDLLERISRKTGAHVVYPHEVLCPEYRCLIYDDAGMIYWDDDHLSEYGARKVGPVLKPFFAGIETARTDAFSSVPVNVTGQ